jgi:hypothetical protein
MKAGGITARTIELATDDCSWANGGEVDLHSAGKLDYSSVARKEVETLSGNPDILIIHSPADIAIAKRTGKLGVIVSFEGGAVVPIPEECNLLWNDDDKCMSNVRDLYGMGQRVFQPYWPADSWLKGQAPNGDYENAPLNTYGVRVIQEAARAGFQCSRYCDARSANDRDGASLRCDSAA